MPSAETVLDPEIAARLKRDAHGLVAAVVQQYDTGEVLMVGWMDDEALHRTLTTGRATYWSPQPAGVLGQGRDVGQPAVGQGGARSTATATPCWSRSTRWARPATPATAPASTPGPAAGAAGLGAGPETAGGQPVTTVARDRSGPTTPDLEEFRALAPDRRVIPVTRRLLADGETPRRRLPQARRRPAGHVPARVGRARRRVVALLLRRRTQSPPR